VVLTVQRKLEIEFVSAIIKGEDRPKKRTLNFWFGWPAEFIKRKFVVAFCAWKEETGADSNECRIRG
jgi:hypothetical protein